MSHESNRVATHKRVKVRVEDWRTDTKLTSVWYVFLFRQKKKKEIDNTPFPGFVVVVDDDISSS